MTILMDKSIAKTVTSSTGMSRTITPSTAINIGTLPAATDWKPVNPSDLPQFSNAQITTALNNLQERIITKVIPQTTFIATEVEAAVLTVQTGQAVKAGDQITPMTVDGSQILVNVPIQRYSGNRRT